MLACVYNSIDEIGGDRLAALPTGLDLCFGLLRVMERSIWGELLVRYVTVESRDTGTVLAFTPVYIGSNLNFNALLPKSVQRAYNMLVDGFGSLIATRVAIAGSLISDRGWIPMHPDLLERQDALRLLLEAMDRLAKEHHAKLGMLKDIHRDFPEADRDFIRKLGYTEGYSLPTIHINTDYNSFEEYLSKHLSKNGRRHARKQFTKAEGIYSFRVVENFGALVPRIFPLHRAVFLKAKYQFEELGPRFFSECAQCSDPKTELLLCERKDGHLAGSLLIFYNQREQQNKRVGIDYSLPDSALIYNLLGYVGIQRAIERGIPSLWLGQGSYLPKTRLGGELEDQYLLIKAYDPTLKPTLPLQRMWMSRYSATNVQAGLEQGVSV